MATQKGYFPVKRFMLVAVFATALVTSLYAAGMNTETRQHASQDVDLNTANTIDKTNNADGTMGPALSSGNFSTSLPASSKGFLKIHLKKSLSENGNKGNLKEKGGNGKTQEGATPALTSLVLNLSKIEVHLANLCGSGNITSYPNTANKLVPSPNNRKPLDKLTDADKWETLELGEGNATIDLFELAKGDISEQLGLTTLACGKYTQIRLYVASATATYGEGTEVQLSIPEKMGIVKIVRPFDITTNQTTDITIEFNAEKSIVKAGETYILKPVVAKISHTKLAQ